MLSLLTRGTRPRCLRSVVVRWWINRGVTQAKLQALTDAHYKPPLPWGVRHELDEHMS